MSDSVVKLRIDSKEYDANIKRAGEALQQYFQKVKEGGGTLNYLDEGVLEAVQAMGELGTMAKNAKGGLRELTQATTDMTIAYRSLTDEEKASPLGQAMQQSIQQMTERAGQMKDAMMDVEASVKNAASDTRAFDQIAGAANLATSGFQTLQGAAKMMGIEMGDNVEVIAKLQAAMAVTNGLTQIQTQLQKQSAVMQGVMAVQTKAAAVAQELLAQKTALATAAGKAFNIVAKANPVGLLVTVIGAAAGAMALLSSKTDEAADAQVGMTDAAYKTKNALDDMKRSADFGEQIARSAGVGTEALAKMSAEAAKARQELAKSNRLSAENRLQELNGSGDLTAFGEAAKNLEQAIALEKEADEAVIEANRNYRQIVLTRQKVLAGADSQTTEKGINAAIAVLKELRSEVDLNSQAYENYSKQIANLEAKLPQTTTGGGGNKNNALKIQTEEQEIASKVGVLTVEYQHLATAAKTADDAQLAGITDKMTAIKDEIKALQDRNDELKKFADEAKGVSNIKPVEMVTGTSGFNTANIGNWTSMMQEQLSKADFGTPIYMSLKNNIAQMDAVVQLAEEALKRGLNPQDLGLDNIFEQVFNREAVDPSQFQGVVDTLNWVIKDGLDPLVFDVDTNGLKNVKTPTINKKDKEDKDKKEVNLSQEMSKIVGGVSGMLSGIEDLGVKLPEGLKDVMSGIQGLISILTSISTIVSAIEAISAADTLIPFARGGVVRAAGGTIVGNSYSGDNMLGIGPGGQIYGLNAGEVVLNRAESGVIASALEGAGGSGGGGAVKAILSGEQCYLMIDRYARRTGKGEMMFWRN